jgi:chemotaxis family two-component system response regulator PixG
MGLKTLIENLYLQGEVNGSEPVICSKRIATWNFHTFHSKLLYPSDETHGVRRWHRALKRHCPKWNWWNEFSQLTDHQLWECQLLDRGVQKKQISLIQAKLVVRAIAQECLFELSHHPPVPDHHTHAPTPVSSQCGHIALSLIEIQSICARALMLWEKWQAAGFSYLSPTLAPILQQGGDHQTLPILDLSISDKYLNADFTLWDIASLRDESVTEITCSLLPLVEKGIVQLQKVPDLPISAFFSAIAPAKQSYTTIKSSPPAEPVAPNPKQPLIACIDDSPVLAYTLKKILMPAGYKVLSIPEPMRGFSQLIEHKPNLILLDLLLPNADGYSICKFLRDTPVFKETPIIILTAKNSFIDRTRAQLAGATAFLSKPPQSEELLGMVQKHLELK